jgi:hypothetical protein
MEPPAHPSGNQQANDDPPPGNQPSGASVLLSEASRNSTYQKLDAVLNAEITEAGVDPASDDAAALRLELINGYQRERAQAVEPVSMDD